jgi:phage-related baseplate assembly protein
MSRFTSIDLSAYPVSDILEALSYEAILDARRSDLGARWNAVRLGRPDLPALDALMLETSPASVILQEGAYRELILRAAVNDRARALTLAGASGRALDHIGITYYRAPRLQIAPAVGSTPAVMEDDESYRQRLALAPESWSTAGPVGAYLFWAMSATSDVLDVAVYSEDEGVCLAPRVRVVVLSRGSPAAAPQSTMDLVFAALDRAATRPMADLPTVESAQALPYNLECELTIPPGVSASVVTEAARQRLISFCSGRTRWIGDAATGPTWLIGRSFTDETLAAAAMGGDRNILAVDIAGGNVNLPHQGYTRAALAGVGQPDFQPLPSAVSAHLFRAPRLGTVTITTTTSSVGWVS